MSENVKINRGLKGIYFERSAVSHIDGSAGTLSYRGYSIDALATQSTFEEVSYLLIYGDLPTQAELADFDAKLKDARELPASVYDVIRATKDGHPMDVLRTATSALAALTPTSQDVSVEAFIENGIKLTSQVPMIIAAHDRIRNGLEPVAADKTLSHAANWLWMLKGEKPSEDAARLADVDFILHAEHGSNASSFAARVTIGTEANLHGAIVTALSTLAGPAHGGANQACLEMLREIGSVDRIPEFIARAKDKNDPFRLMGFGHRVYKNVDPRATVLKKSADEVLELLGIEDNPLLQVAKELEQVALNDEYFISKKLFPNVDFYSGIILEAIGFPTSMFTPIFALSRTVGWISQWKEMIGDPQMKIGRPRQLYLGETTRDYVDIENR